MSAPKQTRERTDKPQEALVVVHRLRRLTGQPLSAADGIFFDMLLTSDELACDVSSHDGDLYVRMKPRPVNTPDFIAASTRSLFEAMVECDLTDSSVISGAIPWRQMNPDMPVPELFASYLNDVSVQVHDELAELRSEQTSMERFNAEVEQLLNS